MRRQQRLDAEVAGQLVPKGLAAAKGDPALQVMRVKAAIAGQAGEKGEAAVGIEVVVRAGEIEIGVSRTHGGEPVGDAEAGHQAYLAAAHRSDALGQPVRLIGRTGDAVGPWHGEPQLLQALGDGRRGGVVSAATAVAVVATAAAAPVDFRNSRRSIEHPLGKAWRASKPIGTAIYNRRARGATARLRAQLPGSKWNYDLAQATATVAPPEPRLTPPCWSMAPANASLSFCVSASSAGS